MKILVIAITASVTVAVIAGISLFVLPDNRSPCTFCPAQPSPSIQLLAKNNSSVQNVTTVIIPKDSVDSSSGKNYQPDRFVVVQGINNTVTWINEDDVGNTIVANNYDDPNFANATKTTSTGYMHLNLTNFLAPGKSFTYTFTKVGYFGYHGEPHPWLAGWVLVLPQDTENLTQTVVVNDTDIMGPCAIFEIPCPNTNTFTAQKFGTNIYIEKITINGVDNYAVVNPEGYCVYPSNSYRNPCTNTVNLAILRLVGVDVANGSVNLETSPTVQASNQTQSVNLSNFIPPPPPPSLPPLLLPNGSAFVNYTALAYAKRHNWGDTFVEEKYHGTDLQITATISNALKFSATVTDPVGVIHYLTPAVQNGTLMQIQYYASVSDPDGNYSVAFNVVNGSNTSNVNLLVTGNEIICPPISPPLHAVPP